MRRTEQPIEIEQEIAPEKMEELRVMKERIGRSLEDENTRTKVAEDFSHTFSQLGLSVEQANQLRDAVFVLLKTDKFLPDIEREVLQLFEKTKLSVGDEERNLIEILHEKFSDRAKIIAYQVIPHLKGIQGKVIDYGAGDGQVTQILHDQIGLDIEGVDVRLYQAENITVPIKLFNGGQVDVANGTYQAGLLTNVLHHEKNNEKILEELDRIIQTKLVVLETVPIGETEEAMEQDKDRTFMNDYLYNHLFHSADVPVPGTFETPNKWIERFKQHGWRLTSEENLGFDQPTVRDRHYLLTFEKDNSPSLESQESKQPGWHQIDSLLKGPNGEQSSLKYKILEDGKLRGVNFWDLDETLLYAKPIHGKTVELIFPEVEDKEELRQVYFAGFKLGNSFREWDRMYRIYREGQIEYKDPEKYRSDWVLNPENKKLIDEPNHLEGYHERAEKILNYYGAKARLLLEEMYHNNPEYLESEEFLNNPIYQLIIAKKRLGQLNYFMTANQRDFARGLVTYSGLWRYGIDVKTDEDMVGGGKEIIIQNILKELEAENLHYAPERVTVIGDSFSGDIGSGALVGASLDSKLNGVLIHKNDEELGEFSRKLETESENGELHKIINGVELTSVPSGSIPKSEHGIYNLSIYSLSKLKRIKP